MGEFSGTAVLHIHPTHKGLHVQFLFTEIVGAKVEGRPILILPRAAKCLRPGLLTSKMSYALPLSYSREMNSPGQKSTSSDFSCALD